MVHAGREGGDHPALHQSDIILIVRCIRRTPSFGGKPRRVRIFSDTTFINGRIPSRPNDSAVGARDRSISTLVFLKVEKAGVPESDSLTWREIGVLIGVSPDGGNSEKIHNRIIVFGEQGQYTLKII